MNTMQNKPLNKNNVFHRFANFQINGKVFCALIAFIIALKLFLTSQQMIFIYPDAAPIDDELFFGMAQSITQGNWLGEYNWLTLSKYPLFSVWLAFLHALNIPYLLGGQILYTLSCLCALFAVMPVINGNKMRLLLFFVLMFNPVQTAAVVQLRVYRENISSALALLLFAGFIGAALRIKAKPLCTLPFVLMGGIGLSGSYLNREDGIWFLIFCIPASVFTVYFALKNKEKMAKKAIKCALQALPYAVLTLGICAISFMNLQYYGRFTVSDYTSTEFTGACGALMRVSLADEFEQLSKIPVSVAALDAVAEHVEIFAPVNEQLKQPDMINGLGDVSTGEYSAGGFFWALRSSVYAAGLANNASGAQQFYAQLTSEINALCANGTLPYSGGELSSTLMPFKAQYILPVLGEGFLNFTRMLLFSSTHPMFSNISISPPEDTQVYETYLLESVNIAAQPNTSLAYYSPLQNLSFLALSIIRYGISAFMVFAFIAALLFQIKHGKIAMLSTFKGEKWEHNVLWWVQLGLILSVVLRCLIIAYMFVTAFNPWVGRVPYLCCAQPALLLFCIIGLFLAAQNSKFFNKV